MFSHVFPQRFGGHDSGYSSIDNVLDVVVKISIEDLRNTIINGVGLVERIVVDIVVVALVMFIIP